MSCSTKTATREDITALIAAVADVREVHVTEAEFGDIVAEDETALAAMMALSSLSLEGAEEAKEPNIFEQALARDAAESADVEMTDARWSRAEVAERLARMDELSDYKAEATEKNASRESNSTERGGGMDR